jgi:hypothetical protein
VVSPDHHHHRRDDAPPEESEAQNPSFRSGGKSGESQVNLVGGPEENKPRKDTENREGAEGDVHASMGAGVACRFGVPGDLEVGAFRDRVQPVQVRSWHLRPVELDVCLADDGLPLNLKTEWNRLSREGYGSGQECHGDHHGGNDSNHTLIVAQRRPGCPPFPLSRLVILPGRRVRFAMLRILPRASALIALILCGGASVAADPLDLSDFRDRQPVMVVYTRSRDDVRPFSFNLDVSTNWNNLTARDVAIIDVDPLSHDVDAVAEQFGIGDRSFAVVLVGRDGSVLAITEDETALRELLRTLDLSVSPGGNG